MRLKLVLRDHVEHLGRRGEIVEVAPGYGRNFLIPKGLAIPATPANLQRIDVEKRKFEAAEASKKQELAKVAAGLGQKSFTVEAKANEEGHLFGSVSYKDIQKLLADEGIQVEEKAIALVETDKYPIKERGIYPFKVHLHPEIAAECKLWVVEEAEK